MIISASWYSNGVSISANADTVGELQSALAAFPPSGNCPAVVDVAPVVETQWVEESDATDTLEPGLSPEQEPVVRRRPRRKRREVVEAPVVEAPVVEEPVLTKPEPFPEPVLPEATAPKAASAQDLTESFAAPAASKDVVAATQAKKAALSDVSAALLDASARGVGLDALRGLIQQVGGVERVSDVAPEKWSALIAAFKGATA